MGNQGVCGYVYSLQVYTRKNLDSGGGVCTRVVLELMSSLENYHNELFTRN